MFASLFHGSYAADLYIDLGTANTLVSARGKNMVLNEPSLIAYNELNKGKRKIIAVGLEAKQKAGRTPGNIILTRPLKEGVVADFKITEIMLKHFLSHPNVKSGFMRPRLLMSLPHGVTDIEREALKEAGLAAGARVVYLVDEPMVAAVGAGLPVREARGCMLVDLGGGTTEVAVIALADIVFCKTVRIGGHKMDEAIIEYMKDKKNLIINDITAEILKISIGTALPKVDIQKTLVNGRDASTGLPHTIEVSSQDIGEALAPSIEQIVTAISTTLEHTPPELVSDIIETGLVLTGGGALIRHLDKKIEKDVKLPVRLSEDPLTTIALGGAKLIADKEFLDKVRIDEKDEEDELG